ncbi:uncharacterized protein EKO05_0000679 [Ascochyta rabiei]|uniref:Uncharacterized protein n=1 Tax=Didymella rabiei TaxID=5454 RepID=A0A162VVH7_DIDRA|nr:uncharacterized protein EKO05_0000679 [Ascochyta rabiei]KZM18631.1 hypothetical protein ST47_g10244 [Ascochyta rabiei]UPX10003.1 hypothetical protein EKO05_0000679 [Ascochyta rabiei]
MASSPQGKQRLKEDKDSIKDENEQKRFDTTSRQSTIAQFIKSGQVAFGGVDPQPLKEKDEKNGEVQTWMLDRICERLADASELNGNDILALRPLLKLEYCKSGLNDCISTGFSCLLPQLLRLMQSNLTCAVNFSNHVLDAPDNEVPREMKEELLCSVAQILGAVSIEKRDSGTIKRQLATLEDAECGSVPEPQPQAKLTATAFGIFTKRLCSLGLFKPIESMLARLRSEMSHVHIVDLHTIYVPFLQELIGLMLVYGIPLKDVTYSSFFEAVLQQYLERFVGQVANGANDVERENWNQRAFAARAMLESFDHSYFRDILGDRYDRGLLPALLRLFEIAPSTTRSQPHNLCTTTSSTQSGEFKETVKTAKDKIDPALTASNVSLHI